MTTVNISHTDTSEITVSSPRSRKSGFSECQNAMCEQCFLWSADKSLIPSPESHVRITHKTKIHRCFTRMAFYKIQSLVSTEQSSVSVVMIKTHMLVFTFFMNRKYATPTMVGATSVFCSVKTDRRLSTFIIADAIATSGCPPLSAKQQREFK